MVDIELHNVAVAKTGAQLVDLPIGAYIRDMNFTLRFSRILASALICYVAFIVASSYLQDPEAFRGLMYHIGASIFLFAFTWPRSLPILLAVCGALMVMDRLGLRKPWHYVLFWCVLGAVLSLKSWTTLPIAASTGLLYWALTGRVAGAPGYNWLSIKSGGLLPKVVAGTAALYVAFVLTSWMVFWAKMAWVSAFPPDPGDPPFAVQFEREMTPRMKVAMMEFPDAQSCVAPNAGTVAPGRLVPIDWRRIDNSHAAQVCLFRLLAVYGDAGDAAEWLEGQVFKVSSSSQPGRPPNVDREGRILVAATWSNRTNGPLYRHDSLLSRIMVSSVHGTGVHTVWSPDGKKLLWISLSSTTL